MMTMAAKAMLVVAGFMLVAFSSGKVQAEETTGQVKQIAVNEDVKVEIESYGKQMYQFTVPAQGKFQVSITNNDPTGQQELGASLIDSNNVQLTSEYVGSNYTMPEYGSNANQTYYLKLEDENSAWKTTFTMKVNFTATSDFESEPNNDAASADTLPIGSSLQGAISNKEELDMY